MIFSIAGGSIKGGREYQEDVWLAFDRVSRKLIGGQARTTAMIQNAGSGLVVIVADGVGGGGNGDVASYEVASEFMQSIYKNDVCDEQAFVAAMESANDKLFRLKGDNPDYGSMMGTTLIACVMDGDAFSFLSVGDSSILRFRDDEMHIVNVHHEHGLEIDSAVAAGRREWREARQDRNRSAITSAVLGRTIDKYQFARRRLQAGDIYAIASDGIEVMPNQLICRIVNEHMNETPEAIVSALLDMAEKHGEAFSGGRHDNTTVVIIKCEAEPAANSLS